MSGDLPLCPACQSQVRPEWPFCTHCGSSLAHVAPAFPVCANCGAAVDPNDLSCWKCGAAFESDAEPLPDPPVGLPAGVTEPEPPPGVPPAPDARPAGSWGAGDEPRPVPVCANCGAAVDTTGAFCWKCGVPLDTGREPFVPGSMETPEPPAPATTLSPAAELDELLRSRHPSHRPTGTTPAGGRALLGGVLLLVGVVLLVTALLVPWYLVSANGTDLSTGTRGTFSGTIEYYPLNRLTESVTSTGSYGALTSAYSGAYPTGGVESLGSLYTVVSAMLVLGTVLGALSAYLAFSGGRHRSGLVVALAIGAILFAALAPVVTLVGQPGVITSQAQGYGGTGFPTGGSSPGTAFFGSCAGNGCGSALPAGATFTESWGPAIGWFLSLGAAGPLIVGFILGRRQLSGPVASPRIG